MPPATAAAQATTSTPNRSRRRRTPRVAPLMANTKVAPRSIASNSIVSTLHRLQQPAEMAECGQGEHMAKRPFRHGRTVRFVVGRRRLLLSLAAGLVFFAVLPDRLYLATRFIFAWDVMTALYVSATLTMMVQATVETCHNRAALYDEGDWVILVLVVASAAASFVAIFAELASLAGQREPLALGLAITAVTVALSWTFPHVVFTLHYANVYYKPDDDGPGGLHFPGNRAPDYRDFLYYSFVIGFACQTGGVPTISPAMRRLTLVHGVVAFAFNTAILALTINVGGSTLH